MKSRVVCTLFILSLALTGCRDIAAGWQATPAPTLTVTQQRDPVAASAPVELTTVQTAGFSNPILGALMVLLAFWRLLSRDAARRGENEGFSRFFNPVKSFFTQTARRIREVRTHRYRTCPNCRVNLRLPVKRGKNTVICPRCKQRVHVRIWI